MRVFETPALLRTLAAVAVPLRYIVRSRIPRDEGARR